MHILLQWIRIDVQTEAMEPLFGKVVILERHSVKGHRDGLPAARKIDCRSNLNVIARHEMHFRHIMGVV